MYSCLICSKLLGNRVKTPACSTVWGMGKDNILSHPSSRNYFMWWNDLLVLLSPINTWVWHLNGSHDYWFPTLSGDLSSCIAENGTIKCSTVKSGIFPCTLEDLWEGYQYESSTFYPNCGPAHQLRTPMNNCCHPWDKKSHCSMADWRPVTQKIPE